MQQAIALSVEGLPEAAAQAFYALGAFAPKPASFDRPAAETVSQAEPAVLALLAARNLLELEGDRLALHQTLADAARHRAHYLALANADWHDWRRIEAAYPQLKWAWANTPAEDEARMAFIWALRIYQTRRGLWRDRLTWSKAGLALSQSLGNRKDEGTLLNNIGAVYHNLGQRQEALAYYQRALPILEEVGDRDGESITRWWLGLLLQAEGHITEAVTHLRRAVELAALVQSPHLEQLKAALAQVEAKLAGQGQEEG